MFIHRTRIRSLHSPQRSGGKGILLLCRNISRVVIFVHHAAIARPVVLTDELPQIIVVILVLNDAAGIGNLRDVPVVVIGELIPDRGEQRCVFAFACFFCGACNPAGLSAGIYSGL